MSRISLLAAGSMAALTLLAGCAALNAEDIEAPELAMPAAYEFLQASAGAPVDPAWWSAFNTPALNALEARAMEANNQLLAGIENIVQSRATLRQSRAVFLPQLSASESTTFNENTGGGRVDENGNIIPGSGGGGGYSENSSARVSASYELDLFGGNAAAARSSRAALATAIYNQRNLELQVQSQVASAWFNVLSLQERLESSRRNLQSVERVMELVQRQYDEGAVSGFDLSRQRSAVASAQATIPQLEQQLAAAESALAILMGEFPENFDPPVGDIVDILPPAVAVGIPSDLLLRRPDLLAAEAGLAGADADVAAARAAFFPSFNLNAGANISDLFGAANLTTSFGGSIAATIFSGGRLEAALERSQSRERQLIINYRQSVLTAVKEVEDALAALSTAEQRETLQQIASDEAQRSFDLSQARYQAGAAGLLDVLDAQRQLLTASDQLVQARQARLNAAVDLFSALGGGWTPDPEAGALIAAR